MLENFYGNASELEGAPTRLLQGCIWEIEKKLGKWVIKMGFDLVLFVADLFWVCIVRILSI